MSLFLQQPSPQAEGGFFSRVFTRRPALTSLKAMTQAPLNYGKTQKGKSALEQRSAALPPRLRPLLLLIDGSKSTAQLQALLGQIGMDAGAITELESLGFIALGAPPLNTPASHAAADDDDRTVRVSSNAIDRFLHAKRFMSQSLAQAGVTQESSIAAQIEAATEMSQLTQAYEGFVALIQAQRPAEAPAILAKLRAFLG